MESVRTVRSVGVFAGSSRGHWGKEPRHPGQHCNRPEPCSRERGSLLPRQGCLHLNLTDGPRLRLFIQHLQEATRRPPQAPGECLPLRSRPGSWAQSSASGQHGDGDGGALQTPPRLVLPCQTLLVALLGDLQMSPLPAKSPVTIT